jgi:hypothetical protein
MSGTAPDLSVNTPIRVHTPSSMALSVAELLVGCVLCACGVCVVVWWSVVRAVRAVI